MNNFKNTVKANFTAIPNVAVEDDRMSWKAKGIFLYLASKPDNWEFYMNEIKKNATDGKTSLQTGIKELEEFGYLKRTKSTNEKNQFDGWDWVLLIPHQSEIPKDGNPDSRKTPSYNKTNSTNKEVTNKDNSGVTTPVDDEPTETELQAKMIAQYLLDSICLWDDTHKYNRNPPSLSSWITDIDRAIRLDGRTPQQLKYIIDVLFRDNNKIASFWAPNVQSGKKLRDQFDTIKNQIKEKHGKSFSQKQNEAEQFIAEYRQTNS